MTFGGAVPGPISIDPAGLAPSSTTVGAGICNFMDGPITDGSLSVSGTANLTLSHANSYGGGTTLGAGTLNVNDAGALGTGPLAVNGGIIDNTSSNLVTVANPVTRGGNFTFGGWSSLTFRTPAVNLSATLRTITFNGANSTLTLSGQLVNTYAGSPQLRANNASGVSGNKLVLAGGVALSSSAAN